MHVVIGDGELVLDPSPTEDRLYRFDEYLFNAPDIRFIARVPGFFDLTGVPLRARRRPLLPLVLNCLTGGRFNAETCVTAVVRILANVGFDVPESVVTPADLLETIHARGLETIEIDTATD